MSRELKKRVILIFCLLAGGMDACTGLLLMCAPGMTLRLMRVEMPLPEALVFIRLIGAFVFSVGSLYLFGALDAWRCRRFQLLQSVLLMTAWVRTVVFVFTTCAIVSGALSATWLSVPLADGSFALFQFWVVMRGWMSLDD